MRNWLSLVVGCCFVVACSEEQTPASVPAQDSSVVDQTADQETVDVSEAAVDVASGSCQLIGEACPTGCFPVYARPLDETNSCQLPGELIMCASLTDAATVITCMVKTETGTIYAFPSTLTPAGWRECSEGEAEKLGEATGECG